MVRVTLGWMMLSALSGCSSPVADEPPPPAMSDASVFDACVDFAERLCEDARPCCEEQYGAFERDGCLATFRRDVCRPGADAVAARRATFDGEAVEACLAAHHAAHAVCVPTWAQTLQLRKEVYAACRVIDGLTPPGGGCSTAATCKRPDGAGTAECIKNVCTVIHILPQDAACPFPSGSVPVCDEGLTCDAPGLGSYGRCVPAIATGAPCDASVLEGTDCGLGSYCDPQSERCAVAVNRGGAGCAQSNECVSFDCDRVESECAPAPAVVDRATCLGPAPAP